MHPHGAGPRSIEPASSLTQHRRSKKDPPPKRRFRSQYAERPIQTCYRRPGENTFSPDRLAPHRAEVMAPRFMGQLFDKNGRSFGPVTGLGHPDPLDTL